MQVEKTNNIMKLPCNECGYRSKLLNAMLRTLFAVICKCIFSAGAETTT